MFDAMITGAEQLADPTIWLVVLISAVYGVFMGAVPGLTATMAVALIVPTTYFLSPLHAIAAIVTLEACAIFAGDIPNALLRIPGTPSSAAYSQDVHTLTQRGKAGLALSTCLGMSVIGGILGALLLMLFAPQLARIAERFSVIEYFWLYLLGLSCAVIASRGSKARAACGLFIGLLLSTVGLSAVHTQARFTFGQPELNQGINFIPAMIGLFGLSEVLRNVASGGDPSHRAVSHTRMTLLRDLRQQVLPAAWRRRLVTLRSSLTGALVGMLPGAGADIAAWVSLGISRRKQAAIAHDDDVTRLEGAADATTANSSALAAAWVPALVFGIPGDSITAIVIGVLLMKNVKPGPEIFTAQAPLAYSIFWLFLMANLVLIPVGLAAIRLGGFLVRIPHKVLMPAIVLFCTLGAYAVSGSSFDIGVMLAMGLLGFFLDRWSVPLGPVVLGLILGGPLEERFIQSLNTADGQIWGLVARPIATMLALITIALWVSMAYTRQAPIYERSQNGIDP